MALEKEKTAGPRENPKEAVEEVPSNPFEKLSDADITETLGETSAEFTDLENEYHARLK